MTSVVNEYDEYPLFEENHQQIKFYFLRIIVHTHELRTWKIREQHGISFIEIIPIEMYIDSSGIEDVQLYTITQHCAVTGKDYFVTKSVDNCYMGEVRLRASHSFLMTILRKLLCVVNLDSSMKKTCPHSCHFETDVFGFTKTGLFRRMQ